MTHRLIESWLPIAQLGIESLRERTPMTPFPAPNRLHVWWARRPLVAARAAILASLLPADADRDQFMRVLGIHGDPVASRKRIDAAKRKGERFEGEAYSYPRAFSYLPSTAERDWVATERAKLGLSDAAMLDPTAGGGAIPFESARLGLETLANDLNPVAVLIQRATYEWPLKHGTAIVPEFRRLAEQFLARREARLLPYYPAEPNKDAIPTNFIYARTITCPHCDGLIPLSPNWRLAPDGTGVKLHPHTQAPRRCGFEIVKSVKQQSTGTVTGGDATCPFPDCGRLVDGDEIKRQAQAGQMGELLYAVIYKRRIETRTKSGKRGKDKWERGYRAPRPEDDVSAQVSERLAEKLPEWEALDIVPSEKFPADANDDRPIQYGMPLWRNLFSPRQLLGHGIAAEVYRELLNEAQAAGPLTDSAKAAFGYLALSMDKLMTYNCLSSRWHPGREVMAQIFERHDFSVKFSYAEMAPLIAGIGYDWTIEQTNKCIEELVALCRPDARVGAGGTAQDAFDFHGEATKFVPPLVTLTCQSGDALDHIADASVDAVVMDPPYYDNVMYAELSDFFYVWLKRTAGYVYPELFRRALTDKDREAVANPARFKEQKGAKALAGRDYQQKMQAIFTEMRRVLKPDGIMTLMFTHKATGAWDALTKGLMAADFTINASWPINTEAEGSLHIKDKSAANSTIFLVCRPRATVKEASYWEDVEPLVAGAVRNRIADFQTGGIRGVDLYLSCFGPALEEFSRHWPLKRGTPRPEEQSRRRKRQTELFEEEYDPYAVTPEDALDAARREVKAWRLKQLTHMKTRGDLDALTSWFVLAWDAFQAPVFPYDEALRLARVCGVDLDRDVVGRLAEKKASDLILWDSAARAAKGALGQADGREAMIDALHHAAHAARTRTLDAARELLQKARVDTDAAFLTALEAVLEVLPVGKTYAGLELPDAAQGAGADFDALENLRRLAFAAQVDAPTQLAMWQDDADTPPA